MKQIVDLVPIVLFFIVYQMDGKELIIADWSYQFDGIFSATQVLIGATVLQTGLLRLFVGRLEKQQLWLLAAVLVFGGATLVFRNQLFIQWKSTVFNWVLALVFVLAPRFTAGTTLMQKALGKQLQLPKTAWNRLNILWIGNFLVVGALNLVVAYRFSEATWVSYKLYSAIGFTLLLTALTVAIVMPHMQDDAQQPGQD